jgi:hypothetical protein
MTPVESSNVAAVGHDGHALWVRFKDRTTKKGEVRPGGVYRYPTAGPEHHTGMLAAESVGEYLHRHIKGAHEGEKVRG